MELKQVLDSSELQFHILVNNTGGPAGGPIFNAKIEDFESAFYTTFKMQSYIGTGARAVY